MQIETKNKMRELKIMERKINFWIFILLSLALNGSQAFAANETDRMGIYLSIHGDPPPSILGLNLSMNISVIRLTGGLGGYTSGMANVPAAIGNYTIMPLGFAFYWLGDVLSQIFTSGKVTTHKNYADYRLPYQDMESVFSYGGAIKLVPLKSNISPLVGVGYSKFESHGRPLGLPEPKGFIYYPVGIDYSRNNFNLGLGYNFTPAIDQAASGFYVNFGNTF